MNSISEEVIKNLNKRLLTQAVIIESLCELLLNKKIITEEELEDNIQKNIDIHEAYINSELINSKKSSKSNLVGFNFGIIGEC